MTAEQYLHVSVEMWGGFFCIIAMIAVFMTRKYDRKAAHSLTLVMLCSIALLTFDALSWFVIGDPKTSQLYSGITHFGELAMGMLIMPLVADYVSHIIFLRTRGVRLYWSMVEWIVSFAGVLTLIINVFHPFMYEIDHEGTYIALPWFFAIPAMIVFVGLLMTLSVTMIYIRYLNNLEKIAVIMFLVLPMLSLVLRVFDRSISYINVALVISVMIMFISYVANYSNYMAYREKQLSEEKIRIINNQMQPHFIFNSLALIRYEVLHSPEKAVETINDFSAVMRRTTDFTGENKCITVKQELDLVRHYLNIQKKRFDESIDIVYNVTDTEFDVPPFLIQTVVENSLHHGLKDGQTEDARIVISTEEEGSEHVVTVSDNGTGFDTGALGDDGRKHVGLKNTRERLELMCGGRLEIVSHPGEGTTVRMIIPD